MRQLLVLSGKGGTGKTTVSSAFIKILDAKAYADCDVDAPNLHLVLSQNAKVVKTDYYGLPKAEIDSERCAQCGLCKQACRFDAIYVNNQYHIDENACEGCAVCELVCPSNAITMRPSINGEIKLFKNHSTFSTAQLKMGSGNSGMLVTDVKKQMKNNAEDVDISIIDGSPGIGCPVIASLSGVDMVLIVTEPSLSGISDMERIIHTAQKFQTKICICVNKYDVNLDYTEKIQDYCKKNHLPFVGKIPYDTKAIKAINNALTIVDVDCEAKKAVTDVFNQTMEIFNKDSLV